MQLGLSEGCGSLTDLHWAVYLSSKLHHLRLSFQVVAIGLRSCATDTADLAVGHGGWPVVRLGLRQPAQELQSVAGKAGVLCPAAWPAQVVQVHQSLLGRLLLLQHLMGLWWVVQAVGAWAWPAE